MSSVPSSPSAADIDRAAHAALNELRSRRPPRLARELETSLAALEKTDALGPEHAFALGVLGTIQSARSDLADATSTFAQVLALAGGQFDVLAHARAELALIGLRQGLWDEAARHASVADQLARRHRLTEQIPAAVAAGALVPAAKGELPTALARIDEAETLAEVRPTVLAGAIILHARLCIAIGLNDWALLQRLLDEADASGSVRHFRPEEWFALRLLAAWHLGQRALSDELHADWAATLDVRADPYYHAFESVLHSRDGRHADEVRSIRRALELLGPAQDPLGRTWVRIVAGTAISKYGGASAAPEGLAVYKEARAELARIGASIFVARCDSIIATTSRLLEDAAASNPITVLSEQQQRVARLVSHGYTSNEIAPMLGVSKKTVDFHVGNILARLGVTNRREIRRIIVEADRA
jgi:DNA-binding CsgD family transcriptional regulator